MNHLHVFPLGTHNYPGGLWVVFADLSDQCVVSMKIQAADVSLALHKDWKWGKLAWLYERKGFRVQ